MSTQFRRIIPVLIFLFCSSCMTTTKPKNTVSEETGGKNKGTVLQHLYQPIANDHQPDGYGMYTYVLMRKHLRMEDRNTLHEKRLRALLKHITAELDPVKEARQEKKYYNLFLYPSQLPEFKPDVSFIRQYDFDFSKEIVEQIVSLLRQPGFNENPEATALLSKLINHDGPFLISMIRPYNMTSDAELLFFADLSGFNPIAIEPIVDEYKKQMRTDGSGVEEFESIRLNILDALLILGKSTEQIHESAVEFYFDHFNLISSAFAK